MYQGLGCSSTKGVHELGLECRDQDCNSTKFGEYIIDSWETTNGNPHKEHTSSPLGYWIDIYIASLH